MGGRVRRGKICKILLQCRVQRGTKKSKKTDFTNETEGYTDKNENKFFLIYKEIQKGAVGKSDMTNGLLI
jgi:hypothetical protein